MCIRDSEQRDPTGFSEGQRPSPRKLWWARPGPFQKQAGPLQSLIPRPPQLRNHYIAPQDIHKQLIAP
eukprot:10597980-Prorocentrum_lima.AAC.1